MHGSEPLRAIASATGKALMTNSVPPFVIATASFKTWRREKRREFAIISDATDNCHPTADSSYAIGFVTCHQINDNKSGTDCDSGSNKSDPERMIALTEIN